MVLPTTHVSWLMWKSQLNQAETVWISGIRMSTQITEHFRLPR
jgi:hypothetical protein